MISKHLYKMDSENPVKPIFTLIDFQKSYILQLIVLILLLDLHPPASPLPVHDAAQSRGPPLSGGPAPQGEKGHHRQQSGR